MRILGTTRLYGIIGRANPYVGEALLGYDAYFIGSCVKSCIEKEARDIGDCRNA